MPIVSTLDRGQFTVKLRAFSSQREDYEEFPITVEVCIWQFWNNFFVLVEILYSPCHVLLYVVNNEMAVSKVGEWKEGNISQKVINILFNLTVGIFPLQNDFWVGHWDKDFVIVEMK